MRESDVVRMPTPAVAMTRGALRRYRVWQVATLLVLAGAVVAVVYTFGLFGDPGDWTGSAEGAVVFIGVLLIGIVPAAAALFSLVVARRRPRAAAALASAIPLSVLLLVWGAGGSVQEDPLLFALIVPGVLYLVLCASILLAKSSTSRQPPPVGLQPMASTDAVSWPAEPPYRDD